TTPTTTHTSPLSLHDALPIFHPQYYNTGSVMGMDNKVYSQATPDFIVAMSEMLLNGFTVSGTSQTFPALREDQVAFGLPAVSSRSEEHTSELQSRSDLGCRLL